MTRKGKYAAIAAGIASAAVLASGASEAITELLVREAMDRSAPVPIHKQPKIRGRNRTKRSQPNEVDATLSDRAQMEHITITAWDGTLLSGCLYHCDAPQRVILAMHGWRSTWERDFGGIMDFLHESGSCVLFAEQRGMGQSGGEYIGFGMLERFDCLDWLNWLAERMGANLPVYLMGVSMGATTVMLAAGLKLPERVRGIIADCGFTSADEIWKHVCKTRLHIPYAIRAQRIAAKCRRRIGYDPIDCSTEEVLRQSHIPILLFHGTEDQLVPCAMTCRNFAAAAGPKRMITFSGAGHGRSHQTDPQKYETALSDFWSACEIQIDI